MLEVEAEPEGPVRMDQTFEGSLRNDRRHLGNLPAELYASACSWHLSTAVFVKFPSPRFGRSIL